MKDPLLIPPVESLTVGQAREAADRYLAKHGDPKRVTCFIAIGNSDNKLSQAEWHDFWCEINNGLHAYVEEQFGQWLTPSNHDRQSACWGVHVREGSLDGLRWYLAHVAGRFRQDSIALMVGESEMIGPPAAVPNPS